MTVIDEWFASPSAHEAMLRAALDLNLLEEQYSAFGAQFDARIESAQQRRPIECLEPPDLMADRALGHAKFFSRAGERAVARDCVERDQWRKRWKATDHWSQELSTRTA
jgi:hypothetical protein